ncbi:MAG: nucleoside hydrolase [Chloroflexi bacterium]|nr:nucleoside hydrolase [Chloroflexota bacterium]
MPAIQVHLDTDIGGDLDDLCALGLLLTWPGVEIAGVTTVLDDGGKRAGYARYVLDLGGQPHVPVAAGADVSSGDFREAYGLPPERRYWPQPVPPAPGPLEDALDLLGQSIERGATVVALGPFTNLSLLERRSPGVLRSARLCLMGGSIHPVPPGFPTWDYRMDFNVQADCDAAQRVLESAAPDRLTLIPIEVTVQTALRRSHLPKLRRAGLLGRLIAHQADRWAEDERIADRYAQTCSELPADIVNFHHDPLACAVALGWDGVAVETLSLAVARDGEWLRARVDPRGQPLRVVTGVDRARFDTLWLETVTRRTSGFGVRSRRQVSASGLGVRSRG